MPSVNGGGTPWGKCVPLQGDCGMGIQNRTCTNPMHINGGHMCAGVNAPGHFHFKYCNIPCPHKNAQIITTAPSTPATNSIPLAIAASILGVLGMFGVIYIYKIIRRYRCARRTRVNIPQADTGIQLRARQTQHPHDDDDTVHHLPSNDSLRAENTTTRH